MHFCRFDLLGLLIEIALHSCCSLLRQEDQIVVFVKLDGHGIILKVEMRVGTWCMDRSAVYGSFPSWNRGIGV